MTDIEERPGRHKWIHYYEPPKDVVCFKFPVFSWANGCPYSCSYCYLQHTLRRQKSKIVEWTNYRAMEQQIARWLQTRKKIELLNAGELSDSLAPAMDPLPMLNRACYALGSNQGLYLLTKSDGAEILRAFNEPKPNIVVTFSVNATLVAARWEPDAPPPRERLVGAKRLRERGWRVRIRIDPMIPFLGWHAAYEEVANQVNYIQPERVTLGSLRANPGLRARLPDDLRVYLMQGDYVGGKTRIRPDLRLTMYRFMAERLDMPVSLCKETKQIWHEAGAKGPCACLP